MHLEDVVVEGFKSFSEPTSMSFQPGIGVIIGNNGVGKSNILDAIVWAMGEDELAKLRCLEPDEVFFAGSKNYPPAEKVRVELNFKTGTRKDSAAYPLVRELDRSGESRYWVNERECSRQAYLKVLHDHRIMDSLKTIIRQEQINDFLLVDPWERFRWIAELLGTSDNDELARLLISEVNQSFQNYLHLLIPLGEAGLSLIDKNGDTGLDIDITLPGNRKRRAHQLSGGEKSVTSLGLKLALFEQLDSPFYLLDEVEPSLDYTNHKSMQKLLKELSQKKQLIMITHLRSTIELANTLHGVRTRWDGSSFMKFYFVMDKKLLRMYKCC